jgi:hypothetical protein
MNVAKSVMYLLGRQPGPPTKSVCIYHRAERERVAQRQHLRATLAITAAFFACVMIAAVVSLSLGAPAAIDIPLDAPQG